MHKTKVVPPQSHVQASCGAWRGREAADPVDYKHPYPSMAQYAELLALRFDAKRTRHAYYRAMRVLHEHFHCDPATLEETHLRDYLLHIKLHKHWKPKTIRQTLACAKLFFVELLERPLWRVFSQIRTRGFLPIPAKRYSWYPS